MNPLLHNLQIADALALCAALCAPLLFTWALGPWAIGRLRRACAEPIRTDSPRLTQLLSRKQGTPTLGGLLLLSAWAVGACFSFHENSHPVLILLSVALSFGALGCIDDLVKLRTSRRGISARLKLLAQFALATSCVLAVDRIGVERAESLLGSVSLGAWSTPLTILLIVGFANAVNLADGLDGLAAGCSAWFLAALLVVAAVNSSGDVATLACGFALLGALLGFLNFNRFPAQVFMGNTGSSALGALLATLAILLRQEWVLLVAGLVFVAEAASVILQVGYFKLTRRRIFRCAPLHHHYQFAGLPEPTIVRRFWLAGAALALLAVTLSSFAAKNGDRTTARIHIPVKKLSQEARAPREIR